MKEKKTNEWGCKFSITTNGKSLTELITMTTISEMPVPVIAYKVAYEVGETGNLHKHLYVVFERSWRKSALINRFKGSQINRVTPGTEQTVINYIGNLDKEVSKGCFIIPEMTTTFGNLETTQGQRNDISASDAVLWQIKDAIDEGKTKRQIWQEFFPYMVRYGQGVSVYIDQFRDHKKPILVVKDSEEEAVKREIEEKEKTIEETSIF